MLKGCEKVHKPNYILILNIINNLSILYSNQGKLIKIEIIYFWALKGKEKILKLNHTLILNTVYNLGNLYSDQNKLIEAEVIYL